MPEQKKISWSGSKSAVENARVVLPELATRYLAAGQAFVARRPSAAALHRFRLKTKRFRYTLELFQRCYGPGFGQRLKVMHQIQQDLGMVNDCQTSRAILSGKGRPRATGPLPTFLEHLDAETSAKTVTLIGHLKEILQSEEQRRWWTGYLARPTARRGR